MNWWWYITRSTGIVATVLAVASVLWGLKFSARNTGHRLRPAWWLDLHNWLGGSALAFMILHIVAVLMDSDAGFTVTQALVPGAITSGTLPIAYGIVATYLFAVVVLTSWPRLRFKRRVWRAIHLLSLPAVVLTGLHAFQSGSDQQAPLFKGLLVVLTGLVVYPLAIRIFGVMAKRRTRSLPATEAA